MIAVEGVPQAVLDHGVDEGQIAHLLAVAQGGGVGRLAHALLTAGDDDAGRALGDLLGRQRHGAQARAAQLVEAPGRRFHRYAGVDRSLPGRTLPRAGLQHLAQDHFVDVGGGDLRPLNGAFDGDAAQLVGGQAGKGAVERAYGRAGGGNDYDVGHDGA